MSLNIRWKVPTAIPTAAATVSQLVTVYRSTSGENGEYSSIASTDSAAGTLSTYSDSGADQTSGYFYFVTYTPSGGSEGSRVLAIPEPFVTEQRLAEQIQGKLPEIVAARIDSNLIDIRKAMRNALDIVNAYSPQTSYGYTNLPARFEGPLVVMSMMLLYMEHQLQVGLRDYNYGGTGISLQVDRNSKFTTTLAELNKSINGLLAFIKQSDWPDPIGLGSDGMNVPQARQFGFLYGTGSVNP